MLIKIELHDLDDEARDLSNELRDKSQRSKPGFMSWLEDQVEKINELRSRRKQELAILLHARADLMQKSGLENLESIASEFIARFDELTGVQKRSFIERMIAKIVVKQDNQIELHVLWDPKKSVTRTTKSSISEVNGGLSPSLLELLCRPWQMLERLAFAHTPAYRNNSVLHQKYIIEGLSIRQIADEFLSSREAVRKGLIDADIHLRASGMPHGRQSQTKYGQRRINGKTAIFMKEQKIVVAVRQMREQGLSLRQIAQNLSSMGIPTKCNEVKWHPEMIKRILV